MVTGRASGRLREPNHRQQLALDRIDFAVGELATALLSCGRSPAAASETIQAIRRLMATVISEILEAD